MAQVINTNIMSLMAQNNLNKSQNALSTSIQRLSTGYRINSAKDDAAGQGISNRFTSQIRGLTQAARNANDGLSLTQTIEGGLSQINDNLQRIRELSVQALNGTNTMADLTSIYKEVSERVVEMDRISQQVNFNGLKALYNETSDNPAAKLSFQVGANDGETVNFTAKNMSITTLNAGKVTMDNNVRTIKYDQTSAGHDILSTFVRSFHGTTKADDLAMAMNDTGSTALDYTSDDKPLLSLIDETIATIDTYRGEIGATQNRFESIVTELNGRVNNLTASRSRIEDADYATEVSNMTRAQILQQAGTSVLAQANQVPQTVLSLLQ